MKTFATMETIVVLLSPIVIAIIFTWVAALVRGEEESK